MLSFLLTNPPLNFHESDAPKTLIVMHATDGTGVEGSIETLREKGFGYHYIIHRNGKIEVLSGKSSKSWTPIFSHAGNSYGPNEEARGISRKQDRSSNFVANTCVNSYSIGISFANYESKGEHLTPEQIAAAIELVKMLKQKCPTIRYVTTHAIVSPGRKTDPKFLDIDSFSSSTNVLAWRPKA